MTALLFLNSCNQVTVKDEVVIGNKGKLGAVQFHTLKSGQSNLTKAEWDQILLSKPLVCMSVEAFGDVKTFYEQVCSVCGCCTVDTNAKVNDFFSKVNAVKVPK